MPDRHWEIQISLVHDWFLVLVLVAFPFTFWLSLLSTSLFLLLPVMHNHHAALLHMFNRCKIT